MLNGFGNSAPNWLHIFQWLMYLFAFPFEGEKETCFPTFLTLIGICLDPGRFCLFVCFSPQQRFNKSNVSLRLSAVLSSASAKGCWTFAYIHTHTHHQRCTYLQNSPIICLLGHSYFVISLILHPSNVIFCWWQSNQIAAMQVKWHVHLMLIFSSSLMWGIQTHERKQPPCLSSCWPWNLLFLLLTNTLVWMLNTRDNLPLHEKMTCFFFFLQFVWWFCHWVIETVNYSYTN